MANFGGFGGGNMQVLMKQAQALQREAAKAQQEVEETEVEGVASNGLVTITMNGLYETKGIKIDPSIVDPDDVEMLEDMIVVALNDANEKISKIKEQTMGRFGGLM